ncbi:MAG: alanine racemase [Clostridiaceae bacterium]|nr:alanine racemase [Clostridiaceae bacterium]
MKSYGEMLSRSNWVEVDLDVISNNFKLLREMVGPDIKIMPAVKSNAYGHGILESCRILEESGADILGVGSVEEGIALRRYGIKMPILIFASNTIYEAADIYVKENLIPTILYYSQAESISKAAGSKPYPIFVKVETGRGRLGINAEEAVDEIVKMSKLPGVKVAGVYTHLCDTKWRDMGNDYTMWQNSRFDMVRKGLESKDVQIPFYQIANTAASIALSEIRHTGICPGRAIWGYSPLEARPEHPDLKQALIAWKTRIIMVKEVCGGKFGPNFKNVKLDNKMRIGIIPAGLNDGIDHKQAKGYVLVRGKKVPVGSSESLEHTILDLRNFPEVEVGDEVVIMGRQGNECITLNELSTLWDRNLSEFLTGINPTIPRIYFSDGKPVSIAYGTKVVKL